MALDFPTTPANGFVYTSPTGEQWVYETATNSWTSKGLVNTSGGIKYVGTIDITAAPPTGVTGGALYTVVADGTANAGFGPGVTGALTKGDSVMNTGTGWIKLSHPTSVWLRTGTNLAPTATGDVVSISAGTAALPGLTPVGDPNTGIYSPGADQLAISTGATERVRIDASGRLLLGTSTSTTARRLQVEGTDVDGSSISLRRNAASTASPILQISKSRSASTGGYGLVLKDDELGLLQWYGSDGAADIQAARIGAFADGVAGTNNMPGRLVFSTTADGASSPTERMRIDNTGNVFMGGANGFLVSYYSRGINGGEALTITFAGASNSSRGQSIFQITYCNHTNNSPTLYAASFIVNIKDSVTTGYALSITDFQSIYNVGNTVGTIGDLTFVDKGDGTATLALPSKVGAAGNSGNTRATVTIQRLCTGYGQSMYPTGAVAI